MDKVPDENDIIYHAYSIDFLGIKDAFLAWLTGGDTGAFFATLAHLWNIYSIIAIILSILFFTGFVYAKIRYAQLVEIEKQKIREEEAAWAGVHKNPATKNARWDEIQRHISGDNPNNWRLAIIEADILLEEALSNAGYVGATIGDKLKTANVASFHTLQDAWDAHRVRNEIAHSGNDFVLTKRVAQEAIVKFERVFREFDVI